MLSRDFLVSRGYCCGHGCLMCPYKPKHTEGNTNLMGDSYGAAKELEKKINNYISTIVFGESAFSKRSMAFKIVAVCPFISLGSPTVLPT